MRQEGEDDKSTESDTIARTVTGSKRAGKRDAKLSYGGNTYVGKKISGTQPN